MFAKALREHCNDIVLGKGVDLRDRKVLISNMVHLYHIIRASERLLEVAIKMSRDWSIQQYFLDHLEEERGHDDWLLNDLKSAGVNPFPCPAISAEFPGAVYYHIFHTSPVALLGYMLVMEGAPMPIPVLEELEELHGKQLLQTARYHAVNDPKHAEELFKVIDALPIHDQMDVKQMAIETANRLGNLMDKIRGE